MDGAGAAEPGGVGMSGVGCAPGGVLGGADGAEFVAVSVDGARGAGAVADGADGVAVCASAAAGNARAATSDVDA